MKRRNASSASTSTLILILCLIFAGAMIALALSGGGFILDPYTVENGGRSSSGGGYNLIGGIAQAEVGTQVGGGYGLSGGFFGGLPKDTPTPTETPVPGDELLVNGGMESYAPGKIPNNWLQINPTLDKVRCNKPGKTFSHTGDCAYRFASAPGENSTIRQSVVLENFVFNAGDALWLKAYVKAGSPSTAAVVRLIVKYTDGTPKTKVALPFGQTSGYTLLSGVGTIASANIKNMRVFVVNVSTAGAVLVDDVSLFKPDFGSSSLSSAPLRGLP